MNVGSLAGKVWKTLEKNSQLSATALVKESGLKKDEVMLGLGWLFREDKIQIVKVGNTSKYGLK